MDAEKYPELLFKSTGIQKVSASDYRITGDLTIKDQTRSVVLDTEILGMVPHMQGGRIASFSADTKISRNDWDLTWNMALESGGWLVGDEIRIHIESELVAPALEPSVASA